jgi:hypothetical protein
MRLGFDADDRVARGELASGSPERRNVARIEREQAYRPPL